VEKLRDCRPILVIDQLKRYREWADRSYSHALLPFTFDEAHRSISALDLARLADRRETRHWLLNSLRKFAGTCDLLLMPPLCGSRADADLLQAVNDAAGCSVVEMCSIPPGVGGLRLRDVLMRALKRYDVSVLENFTVQRATTQNEMCSSLVGLSSGQEREHAARSFVLATGGILGGGLTLEPGVVRESVFGIDIPVPDNVSQWSEQKIFGNHLVSHLGVQVNSHMQPVDNSGKPYWQNVFFAGRSLGGYDYASEKSGLGVAAATGWQAGRMAAQTAIGNGGRQ
ncbi:MAG: anaerobic glycerol-3-phosphate dehydrogenase subunit B, partial [Desulfovibrio sp.]|nr:anaerobic glycerol-3-phosphate dehydrogenase subunit B [Desulfovibrio sp.]